MKTALQATVKRGLQWYGVRGPDAFRTALWNDQKAPIIGRIAMQQTSVDVTHLPDAQIGDVMTVSMRRLCAGAHLPRVYVDE